MAHSNHHQVLPLTEMENQNMQSNQSMISDANEGSIDRRIPTKGRWTAEEHQCFLDSLRAFGKDWYRVEEAIGTRNSA